MKQLLLIILSILALTSCKESRKDEIARLVKEWDRKEIRFPEHPVFTIQGKDTVDFSFRDADYKVVSYVDSIGCISCKLQLTNWTAFIQEVDSLTNGTIPFVLCLHTADVKEMKRIVRKDLRVSASGPTFKASSLLVFVRGVRGCDLHGAVQLHQRCWLKSPSATVCPCSFLTLTGHRWWCVPSPGHADSDPVDCGTPGFPVLHHPPQSAHTHIR